MTDLDRKSKPGTVLLLDTALADVFVDHGPHRTDLDDGGDHYYESPSDRTNLAHPRSVSVVADMRPTTTGVLVFHGDAGTHNYRVRINAGSIEAHEAGALIVSVAVPGLSVGVDRKVLVHWACHAADGGDVHHELTVHNYVTGAWAHASAVVDALDPEPACDLFVAAAYGGGDVFDGVLRAVRIDRRYVSSTEAREDWVAESTPPTMEGRRRTPAITAPADELALGDDGELAGPALLLAGAATRDADSRLVTPLVNVVPRSPFASETASPVLERYYRNAPDDAAFTMCVRYLWHAFCSPKTNAARVRVHVKVDGDGSDTTPIALRMYSIAGLPVGGPPQAMSWHRTGDVVLEGSNDPGAWVDLGLLRLRREPSGLTFLALAWSFETPDPYESTLVVNAVTVEPLYLQLEDPGLGDVDDKGGG